MSGVLFFILLAHLTSVSSLLQDGRVLSVNLTSYAFNYLMPVRLSDNKVRSVVLDTGNAQLTIVNYALKIDNKTTRAIADQPCLMLTEDYQGIQFWRSVRQSASCSGYRGPVSISSARATVNFTVANNVTVDNPKLHPWTDPRHVAGDMGLAYVNILMGPSAPSSSAFRQILANETGNTTLYSQIFGLDLRAKNDSRGVAGDMQMGGTKAKYSDKLAWAQQATDNPIYHEAFLSDLSVCGVSLLGRLGSSWPMLVDTGFVCVGLPGAIYDTLLAWLNLADIPNTKSLPALSFRVDGGGGSGSGSNVMYIPLASLLLKEAYLNATVAGAPAIRVGSVPYRLCILRGDEVNNAPAPRITLGTLALHSLYFAADFSAHRVGLASKLDPGDELDHLYKDHDRCLKPVACIGAQTFVVETNSCRSPPCSSYFFSYLDIDSQTCQYQPNALGAGMFFVVSIAVFEVVAFFVSQFSALEILHARERHSLAISKVDPVTRYVGRYMTAALDFLLLKSGWVRDRHA